MIFFVLVTTSFKKRFIYMVFLLNLVSFVLISVGIEQGIIVKVVLGFIFLAFVAQIVSVGQELKK